MKSSSLVFFLAFSLICVAAADQTAGKALQVTEIGKESFEADFVSGGQLRMQIRSGDLRVIGSDENKIRVNYSGKNSGKTSDVKVSLKTIGNSAELRVSGGPHSDFRIEIQVPKNSGLYLRMPAGDLEVDGLTGDKDVEIHAGDMTLGVGKADDYGHVDASVNAGDLDAEPFGVSKGGLFRSFDKHGSGIPAACSCGSGRFGAQRLTKEQQFPISDFQFLNTAAAIRIALQLAMGNPLAAKLI